MYWMRRVGACLAAIAAAGTPASTLAQEARLVRLSDIAPSIRQDIRYAATRNFMARRLPGYETDSCLLLRPVALALAEVHKQLAASDPAYGLKVLDCYRPMRAVRAMVQWATSGNVGDGDAFYYPEEPRRRLVAAGYISARSSHAKGIAVDLTLVRLSGEQPPGTREPERPRRITCRDGGGSADDPREVDMGTTFDCFDKKSTTLSSGLSAVQVQNRALLVAAMSGHGFRNYHREWWHFTFAGLGASPSLDRPIKY